MEAYQLVLVGTTVIKGMHHPVSMATSVATGIKGVCYCCLVYKAGQCGCELQARCIY